MNFNSFSLFLFARTLRKGEKISDGRVILQLFQIAMFPALYELQLVLLSGLVVLSAVLLFFNSVWKVYMNRLC